MSREPIVTPEAIKRIARDVGFDLCGIAPAQIPAEDNERFGAWIERGYHADMSAMARHREVRADPRILMKETQSIICCAVNYNTNHPRSTEAAPARGHAWISRFAWGDDYHIVLRAMLKELARRIQETLPPSFRLKARACVDSAPLFERSLAARAGLGWIGKNGALINERLGSYLFLGELLVNLDLPPDAPVADRCGECRLCLEACPGKAIIESRVVDARRCASYLTIEHRGEFDAALGRIVTRNVFGCDICQDVCPWNRRAGVTDKAAFEPRRGGFNPALAELEALSELDHATRFAGSAVARCRYPRFRRNLAAVRTNQESSAG